MLNFIDIDTTVAQLEVETEMEKKTVICAHHYQKQLLKGNISHKFIVYNNKERIYTNLPSPCSLWFGLQYTIIQRSPQYGCHLHICIQFFLRHQIVEDEDEGQNKQIISVCVLVLFPLRRIGIERKWMRRNLWCDSINWYTKQNEWTMWWRINENVVRRGYLDGFRNETDFIQRQKSF